MLGSSFSERKARPRRVYVWFETDLKKSIFESLDDSFVKVGVTGSGKGLTEFQKNEKFFRLKGGQAEDTDE